MIKLIIGLVADISAGKDTVADYLAKKHGFERFTLADFLREEAKKQGLTPNRENLIKIQDKLNKTEGKDGLVKRALQRATKDKVVVAGIRKKEEIMYLRKQFPSKVKILHLTASPEIRFQRIKKRARIGDPKTFEEFLDQEQNEWEVFPFKEIFEMADLTLENNGTLEELYMHIDQIITDLQKLYK